MTTPANALVLIGAGGLPGRVPGETRIEVEPDQLASACATVMTEPAARLATMVGEDARAAEGGFRLAYTFALTGAEWFTVEALVPGHTPSYPSVTPFVPAAHWYEREVRDLLGVVPEGHPDPRELVLHDDWPLDLYPLRKDFDPTTFVPRQPRGDFPFHRLHGDGIIEIPVGPIHAGVIEPGHFRFAAVGERILHLEARLFYTHRGIEKLTEGKSIGHALQIAERICGACSVSHAVSFSQAVEIAAGAAVPARAVAIRTIALELERIYNHVGDLGNLCSGVGFAVGASAGARLKDDLQRLNERITGNRFLRGLVQVGGTRRDFDVAARADIAQTLRSVRADFDAMMALILGADTATERLRKTGILPSATARDLGAVGVAARASGIVIDSRRDHPHAAYGGMNVPIASRLAGDAEARALVRVDEVITSIGMVLALLESLPEGPLHQPVGAIPGGTAAFAVSESPRGENLHWVRFTADGTIDRYRVRSASYPNWPAVAASVPGNMVPDFPVINKSFELCYACNDR